MSVINRFKFRMWDERCKMWLFPRDAQQVPHLSVGMDGLFSISYLSAATEETATIEQWTGLTDSNGQDIYEGDILECCWTDTLMPEAEDKLEFDDRGRPQPKRISRKELGRVEWGYANWKIVYFKWLKDNPGEIGRPVEVSLWTHGTWPFPTTDRLVVGNIHENSELL